MDAYNHNLWIVQLMKPWLEEKVEPMQSNTIQNAVWTRTCALLTTKHKHAQRNLGSNPLEYKNAFWYNHSYVHLCYVQYITWVKQKKTHKPSPSHHHVYRWYKPFPNGCFMALFDHSRDPSRESSACRASYSSALRCFTLATKMADLVGN